MFNVKAVQMMIFQHEMVICRRNHIMNDLVTMAVNGIMKNVVTIVDRKIFAPNRISIIVNSQEDEVEPVATNNVPNVMW